MTMKAAPSRIRAASISSKSRFRLLLLRCFRAAHARRYGPDRRLAAGVGGECLAGRSPGIQRQQPNHRQAFFSGRAGREIVARFFAQPIASNGPRRPRRTLVIAMAHKATISRHSKPPLYPLANAGEPAGGRVGLDHGVAALLAASALGKKLKVELA